MDFEWDPDKRRRNIEKHGIDFLRAQTVFDGLHLVSRSNRKGETRFLAIGKAGGELITVVYTERGSTTRIISARKARDYEREKYSNLHP